MDPALITAVSALCVSILTAVGAVVLSCRSHCTEFELSGDVSRRGSVTEP